MQYVHGHVSFALFKHSQVSRCAVTYFSPVNVSGRHVVNTTLVQNWVGFVPVNPTGWLAGSPSSTYAVIRACSVRSSCRVRPFTAAGQGRKSSDDLSVSGVADRDLFEQCVSYTVCVIKMLGSVRRA
jgi:hypothetical protein